MNNIVRVWSDLVDHQTIQLYNHRIRYVPNAKIKPKKTNSKKYQSFFSVPTSSSFLFCPINSMPNFEEAIPLEHCSYLEFKSEIPIEHFEGLKSLLFMFCRKFHLETRDNSVVLIEQASPCSTFALI